MCKRLVYYYQSETGGRVFFDELGPSWQKHPCTDRRSWRWPDGPAFMLAEGDVPEPNSLPGWRRDGWIPVAKVEWGPELNAPKVNGRLKSATVWSAEDASELKVCWLARHRFNWGGRVMMRRDPRSRHRVEFEAFQLDGGAVRVLRLLAVVYDPLTTRTTLLVRLRDRR